MKFFISIAEEKAKKAHCDFALFLGATPTNAEAISSLASRAAGLKMYLNDTFTTLKMSDSKHWEPHFENWPKNAGPLCLHAEGDTTANAILMAKGELYEKFVKYQSQSEVNYSNLPNRRWGPNNSNYYPSKGRPLHICHVARKSELKVIKSAKELGLPVTCEVCPHHLFLTEKFLENNQLGPNKGQVRPCLVTEEDQQYLWDNLDSIDTFGSDHAPHTLEEKVRSKLESV